MKTLIIAEKPSVAEDIAKALGGCSKNDDLWERDDLIVAAAKGHLVELNFEDEGRPRGFPGLPVIPESFDLKVIDSPGKPAAFLNLQKQIRRRDVARIVNACDAGREGELIFRLIAEKADAQKPTSRMWVQSMTPQALRDAYDLMKPSVEYDNLGAAARCRSEADWLIGINASRAFTALVDSMYGKREQFSSGRVQTPTLAIVVDHEARIANFQPQDYWEILGTFNCASGSYVGKWKGAINSCDVGDDTTPEEVEAAKSRIIDKEHAKLLFAKCRNADVDSIAEETQPHKQICPKLFDLTSLQKEANRRFKFSAKKTLDIAQKLYEQHKVTTYPRTDSQYLPDDYVDTARQVMQQLEVSDWGKYAKPVTDGGWIQPSKRIFDSAKVSDHFAIVPTGQISDKLTAEEKAIFELLVRRFIAVFYPPAEFSITDRITVVAGEQFHSRGKVLLSPGWLSVLREVKEDGKIAEAGGAALCAVQDGEVPTVESIDVKAGKTSPPGKMTEAKLLAAMETAGKLVEDDELRAAMKEKGLGTPATRAATIEALLDDGRAKGRPKEPYLVRVENFLEPTDKGKKLVEHLRQWGVGFLTSAQTTGEWEACLKKMEAGEFPAETFMQSIRDTTQRMVEVFRSKSEDTSGIEVSVLEAQCKSCGARVLGLPGGFRCEAACGWSQQRMIARRPLSDKEMSSLLRGEKLKGLTGFYSATKKRDFSADLAYEGDELKFSFEEQEKPLATLCPKCDSRMLSKPRLVACECCEFKVWRTVCGRDITDAEFEKLLKNGSIPELKGFLSKAKKKFDAGIKLSLEDGKVELMFKT